MSSACWYRLIKHVYLLVRCHRQALAQGIGHANTLFDSVQDTRSVSVAQRVYGQAVCSGFAKLYEQRDHFSDVTILVGGVEARVPVKQTPLWRPSPAPVRACVVLAGRTLQRERHTGCEAGVC